jgi:hypothetical protein
VVLCCVDERLLAFHGDACRHAARDQRDDQGESRGGVAPAAAPDCVAVGLE